MTNNTKEQNQKIAFLNTAMTVSKREDNTEFTHFSDTAPESLTDLFLKHYEVRDQDYEMFSTACEIVHEIHNDSESMNLGDIEENIYEHCSDIASPYNSDRLAYLNIWNDEEIADIFKQYNCTTISQACGIWYDNQVEQMAIIINEWVNED